MELNYIPASGTWSETAGVLTSNFEKVNVEVEKLKVSTIRFKGYFPILDLLTDNVPTPKVGDVAWVGTPFPGVIYDVLEAGTWHATTDVPQIELDESTFMKRSVWQNVSLSYLDTMVTESLNEVWMSPGVTVNNESKFSLLVSRPEGLLVIQTQITSSYKICSRSSIDDGLNWTPWKIIADDQALKADLVNGKVPESQLPAGSGVADGSIVPGKIASQIIEQSPDWLEIFSKEGHWVFKDDYQGINRPDGLPVPTNPQILTYDVISFGISEISRPVAMVIGMDLKVYFLMRYPYNMDPYYIIRLIQLDKYTLNVDFTIVEPFVYNVPQPMKFILLDYENDEPSLSIALNTDLARYDKLTITPTALGLVTLTGILL